jgi:hypothetical protein
LNRNHVHNLPQVVPDSMVIDAFDRTVMPLLQRERANEKEADALAATRDLLQPPVLRAALIKAEAWPILSGGMRPLLAVLAGLLGGAKFIPNQAIDGGAMRIEDYYPRGQALVAAAARERRQAPRNTGAS